MSRHSPGRALAISTMASTFGGLFSAFALFFTAPMLAKVALNFGAPEYFALGIFGLSIVTGISSNRYLRAYRFLIIGLTLATVSIDVISCPAVCFQRTLMGGIAYIRC